MLQDLADPQRRLVTSRQAALAGAPQLLLAEVRTAATTAKGRCMDPLSWNAGAA
jgi:hypothetical protein